MFEQRVFVDANVLYSRTLRDWLFLLRNEGRGGMFQVHTTRDVMTEVLYRKRRQNKDAPGKVITDIHNLLEANIDEILDDFDTTVPYDGGDPDDLHVHAAAVSCGAQILLTADKGFASSETTPYEVYTCDDFFLVINESAPRAVQRVIVQQSKYWNARPAKPGRTRKSLPQALIDAGCPKFAQAVQTHQKSMLSPPPRSRKQVGRRR